jgi:hypothetical protein
MPTNESVPAAAKWRTITVKPVFVRLERPPSPEQQPSGAPPSDGSPA